MPHKSIESNPDAQPLSYPRICFLGRGMGFEPTTSVLGNLCALSSRRSTLSLLGDSLNASIAMLA
jgi:hypothetical protein